MQFKPFLKRMARATFRTVTRQLSASSRMSMVALLTADGPIPAALTDALRESDAGRYETAEKILEDAMTHTNAADALAPHLSRIRFLKARAADRTVTESVAQLRATLAAMEIEIRRQPLYVPAEFWASWGSFNTKMLLDYGLENFKRTVSHNYQNWMMVSPHDSQVRRLHELWPTHRSHRPWLNTIEAPDHVGSPGGPDATIPEYPLAFSSKREIYRVAVGLLWEYVAAGDESGLLQTLDESEIGNPLRIRRDGRLISSDVAHSLRERNLLLRTLGLDGREGLTVAELGAGHGRLPEMFGRTTNYRYVVFDITPALAVSQWYVKKMFPDEKVFEFRHFDRFETIEDELRDCRFAFFTPNQIELFPDQMFDLFVNMNSLMEMRMDQVRNFLRHIDRLTRRAFLSRQWLNWRNPAEGHTIVKSDFALGDRWRVGLDQIDDIFPEFFNQVWIRAHEHAA